MGEVADRGPWYAAGDILLGMGRSTLRAMAFAKPLVVLGERGFWRLLTPESLTQFLYGGWYGIGPGGDGSVTLEGLLRELVASPERRRELGRYSRGVVEQRFSLTRAADLQEEIYSAVLDGDGWQRNQVRTLVRQAAQLVDYEIRRRYSRLRGTSVEDDCNAIQPSQPPHWEDYPMTTPVPFVDIAAQQAEILDEIRPKIEAILTAGAFVGGAPVAEFEAAYARIAGTRHCVGVANGTDALELALRALGVGAGDEVVVPANTFIATAEAVVRAGARPVLVDVDADTLLVRPDQVARC